MQNLTDWKNLVDILQSLATILAIVVSGVWGYWLFVQNRQRYPRARLQHDVICHDLPGGEHLVHIVVTVQNLGNILIRLESGETRLQQVKPFPSRFIEAVRQRQDPVEPGQTEIDYWPMLDCHELSLPKGAWEIEPGESQEIHHDFLVAGEVQVISLYTFINNLSKPRRQIAWDLTTFHTLQPGDGRTGKAAHDV